MEARQRIIVLGMFILVCLTNTGSIRQHRQDEPCENLVACKAGQECQLTSDGLPTCVCKKACPAHSHPVCGSNNKTYDNHCHLGREACLTEKHLVVKHKGPCAHDAVKSNTKSDELCENLVACKAGRECQLTSDGFPICVCKQTCPKHAHPPVCGSNNKTYESHCHLKREACLTDQHLVVKHKRPCAHDAVKANTKTVACLKEDRDQLRSQIIDWLHNQPGIATGIIAYNDLTFAYFFTCDTNKDSFLNTTEFLDCVKNNVTFTKYNDDKKHFQLFRSLCIEAIINSVDTDFDFKLNSTEFQHLANLDYEVQDRDCFKDEKTYTDGQEVIDKCSICICACGHWTCTYNFCDTENREELTPKQRENVNLKP